MDSARHGEALRSRAFVACMLAATVLALAYRLPCLDEKPLHSDEANQAHRTGVLLDTGEYRYDAELYHGPTLYYLTIPVIRLCGADRFADTEAYMYRLVPALFGAALIPLCWLLRRGLGRAAAVWGAVLTAISPAMVYYSRYYIQEMLLVCFTFVVIAAGWRYVERRSLGWAVAAGVGLGLMHATKETCIVAYAALAAAAGGVLYAERRSGRSAGLHQWVDPRHAAAAAVAAGAVSILFYSSFFTNAQGPLDAFRAYGNYFELAGEGPNQPEGPSHVHAWYYYFQKLLYTRGEHGILWTEGFVAALALLGLLATAAGKTPPGTDGRFARGLAAYTVLMALAYSAIPYKTPWCLLGFYHGMILLAGLGAAALTTRRRGHGLKAAAYVLLVGGAGHLAWQAYEGSFVYAADRRNPYAYAHTVEGFLDVVDRVEAIAAVHPDGHRMVIKVYYPEADYWPLPWYLRRFERVGYWTDVPEAADAPVVLCAAALKDRLESRLQDRYQVEYFGLRPNELLLAYIRSDLWAKFLGSRTGPAQP